MIIFSSTRIGFSHLWGVNQRPLMILSKFACTFFTSLLPLSLPLSAQRSISSVASQGAPGTAPSSSQIRLDVVVTTKAGQPVPNLGQQDFTILDNKSPRPINSFKVVTAAEEPVSVILFVDAVNTPYEIVANVRNQTEKFGNNILASSG